MTSGYFEETTETGDPTSYSTHAHRRSDVDTGRKSLHHTLGIGPNQAAPGNHNHYVDGEVRIFDHEIIGPNWALIDTTDLGITGLTFWVYVYGGP